MNFLDKDLRGLLVHAVVLKEGQAHHGRVGRGPNDRVDRARIQLGPLTLPPNEPEGIALIHEPG